MEYVEERDLKYLNKLRNEILPQLPSFCTDFIVGIGMRTTALTRYNYACDILAFFKYLTMPHSGFSGKNITDITLADMETIKKSDIERYLDYIESYYNSEKKAYIKNKDCAKARKLSAIRSLFAYLYKSDMISQNVTLKVDVPKIREKAIVRLEDNEVSDVFEELENKDDTFSSDRKNTYNNNNTKIRDNAIFTLMLGTGIRVSELVGLNVDDIDFVNNSFTVTRKGEKRDILYFTDDVALALGEYLDARAAQLEKHNAEDTPALFLSLRDTRITVRAVEIMVKKYSQTVAPLKKITPHKLRSTYGTALYRATNDIYAVAAVLGHKDINTTKKHYAAINEDIKKQAVNKVKYKK